MLSKFLTPSEWREGAGVSSKHTSATPAWKIRSRARYTRRERIENGNIMRVLRMIRQMETKWPLTEAQIDRAIEEADKLPPLDPEKIARIAAKVKEKLEAKGWGVPQSELVMPEEKGPFWCVHVNGKIVAYQTKWQRDNACKQMHWQPCTHTGEVIP